MKSYTVKDFFKLNSPCYGCGDKVNIHAKVLTDDFIPIALNISITPTGYTIPLSITYNNSLKLIIDPKTNGYLVTNAQKFIEYISAYRIYLTVSCDRCFTFMDSHYLDFNTAGNYIKPTGISSQHLVLSDKNNTYVINSEFISDETTIFVFALKDGGMTSAISNLKLPLLPHYRFKDKEHFIAKIKTYLLFS